MVFLIHPVLCSSYMTWHLPPAMTFIRFSELIQHTEMLRGGRVQASGQIQVE